MSEELIKDVEVKQFSYNDMIAFAEHCKMGPCWNVDNALIPWFEARKNLLDSLLGKDLTN